MSDQLPPEWAIERAKEVLSKGDPRSIRTLASWIYLAFARYIAEHEEPPVDPCVAAGRKLVAETQHNWPESQWHIDEAKETLAGNRDYTLVVKAAIEGVRRGIEIGKDMKK